MSNDVIIKILNIDKVYENLTEIQSEKIIVRKSFDPKGLFSQQIFGPINDYTCQCGKKDTTHVGEVCSICGVKYTTSNTRRFTRAKIKLPIKTLHPVVYLSLMSCRNNKYKRIFEDILKKHKFYRYDKENDQLIQDDQLQGMTLDDLFLITEKIIEKSLPNIYEPFMNKFKTIFVNTILVIPPDTRPAVAVNNKDIKMDDINHRYRDIITIINQYKTLPRPDKSFFIDYELAIHLWNAVFKFYEQIQDTMNGGKKKLIRKNLMGKSVDFSGRGIIVVDPSLDLDEAGISHLILLEVFKPDIVNTLILKGKCYTQIEALEMVDQALKGEIDLYDIVEEVCTGRIIMLNRAPTLHRMSLFAFKVIPRRSKVIHLHPLVCNPYNADFDGDQMAVYVPITKAAIEEAKQYMLPSKNLLSIATMQFNFEPSQTIIYGLYQMTKEGDLPFQQQVEYEFNGEKIITTEGRIKFNKLLPQEYQFINEPLSKKIILNLLKNMSMKYKEEAVARFADKIKEYGFYYSTYYPANVSLENYYVNEITPELKEKIYTSDDPMDNVIKENEEIEKYKSKFKLHELIETSSRGNWIQAKQIFFARGHIADYKGQLISTPIKHSLMDGLTSYEHFISCYGTRKGIMDTADQTAKSGYLTRQLVYMLSSVELDYELEDCGSTDGITYEITKENFSKLYGRYIINNDGTTRLINENDIGKIVKLRSPIRCKGKNICLKCFGELAKIVKSRYIGIISAQSIGEINTQLVLRTFHTSGAVETKKGEKVKQDIVDDINNIQKALSGKLDNYYQVMAALIKIYGHYKPVQYVYFEILTSQLLWTMDENTKKLELWRKYPSNTKYTMLSKITAISASSKLLGYLFNKGQSSIFDLFKSKKNDNILIRFFANKLKEEKHDI